MLFFSVHRKIVYISHSESIAALIQFVALPSRNSPLQPDRPPTQVFSIPITAAAPPPRKIQKKMQVENSPFFCCRGCGCGCCAWAEAVADADAALTCGSGAEEDSESQAHAGFSGTQSLLHCIRGCGKIRFGVRLLIYFPRTG